MKKKRAPRQRKDTDVVSTKLVTLKVTPEEHAAFHALAWYRGVDLSEHTRALLKADLAKAESDGMRAELTRARELLAAIGGSRKPAKKRKG